MEGNGCMVPEKLGFFRKLLARIGKIYYWRKPKKINLWLLSYMGYSVTKKYEEIFKGDTGKAVTTFTKHFVNGAQALMFEMQDRTKLIYTKSLEDLEFISKIALYVMFGPKWRIFFDEPVFIPAERTEKRIAQMRITWPICALCAGIRPGIDLDTTKLREHSYGELLAAALAALLQLVQDYVGNDYITEIQETKCLLLGDPHGEGIVYFHPKAKEETS